MTNNLRSRRIRDELIQEDENEVEILDQAILNSMIFMKCKYKNNNINKPKTAIDCLESLHLYLVKLYWEQRYATLNLRRDLKICIAGILKKYVGREQSKRVRLPPQQQKTKSGCASCFRPASINHSVSMCNDCADI